MLFNGVEKITLIWIFNKLSDQFLRDNQGIGIVRSVNKKASLTCEAFAPETGCFSKNLIEELRNISRIGEESL